VNGRYLAAQSRFRLLTQARVTTAHVYGQN
jgi:hypothetical protein